MAGVFSSGVFGMKGTMNEQTVNSNNINFDQEEKNNKDDSPSPSTLPSKRQRLEGLENQGPGHRIS